jgi:hypothetical protein
MREVRSRMVKVRTIFIILASVNVLLGIITLNIVSALGWGCAILYAYMLGKEEELNNISQKNSKANKK